MRLAALDAALAEADAAAFVHVGSPGDSTIRSLSGASLPCEAAVVYEGAADDADAVATTLVPARSLLEHVEPREGVTVGGPAPTPGKRAAERVADRGGNRVLTPRSIPHDAALYLERANVEVESTDAHLQARERKTDAERAAIENAQAAAESGMAAAASLLADGDVAESGDGLTDEDGPVTAERVRRAANAAMAEAGGNPAGNTVVVGDEASTRASPLPATDPVAVRVAPCVRGYHGLLARTFVADTDGGWERRATLACERAIEMGLDFVDPGETTAEGVAGEVAAELGSYGFPPTDASGDVYGVGIDPWERPTDGDALEPGAVVALEPRIDGKSGGAGGEATVWLADLAVVIEDGAELLGSFSRSVVPRPVARESQ